MRKSTQPTTILVIEAENAKGVLARILVTLDRPNYYVAALNMSKTDVNNQVIITIEAVIPEPESANLVLRLEKIIEVERATARSISSHHLLKAGVFKIDAGKATAKFWQTVQKYGATVTFAEDYLLVQKTGCDNDLQELYNHLDQEYLNTYQETILAGCE